VLRVRSDCRGIALLPSPAVSAAIVPEPAGGETAPRLGFGRARRILVVGTDEWAIEQAARQLGAFGRQVRRCHEPGEPSFPCNALLPGRRCPLDQGVDVVLDMRARPVTPPTPSEFGALCALHAAVPLVVAGVPGDSGFGPWAASAVEDGVDLMAACDSAAAGASMP
jgi:hypothetical protein